MPEATERHLSDAYGYESTYNNYPQRQIGRQVHAEQQSGNNGGAVSERRLLFKHVFCYCPLKEHAGSHTCQADDERTQSEIQERHQQGRCKRYYHAIHITFHRVVAVSVW